MLFEGPGNKTCRYVAGEEAYPIVFLATIMNRIIEEYLRLLCDMGGAQSARVRIRFCDGGADTVVLDQRFRVDDAPPSEAADAGSLFLLGHDEGGIVYEQRHPDLLESIDAGDRSCVSGVHEVRTGPQLESRWEILRGANGIQWCFSGMLDGYQVDVLLDFSGRGTAFVHRRLKVAASFLRLLEPVLAESAVRLLRNGTIGTDGGSLEPVFVGVSAAVRDLIGQMRLVADFDIPVLIEGESGTGKEIVARNIHRLSTRRSRSLVIVNCMEIQPSLLQSELFGHLKGSFTGASRDRIGLIESAAGGTFFLDEIGELPVSLQAALLRVLQEKEVRRIGESVRRKVDVRFVFATNRNLHEQVERGEFREDLYYRVSGMRLHIPPLRQRQEDILPMVRYFLGCCAGKANAEPPSIPMDAMRRLLSYHWPGNGRELRNEIERLFALKQHVGMVTVEDLSLHIRDHAARGETSSLPWMSLPAAVQELERRMILGALKVHGSNRTKTAAMLGITRQGLLKKLKRFNITEHVKSGR
jgi:DNA-binding NtrC family response regulator